MSFLMEIQAQNECETYMIKLMILCILKILQ